MGMFNRKTVYDWESLYEELSKTHEAQSVILDKTNKLLDKAQDRNDRLIDEIIELKSRGSKIDQPVKSR